MNAAANSSASTRLRVSGMTCQNCARQVTAALQEVAGVQSASVDLPDHAANVRWNAGAEKNLAALVAAVARAGYEAQEISPSKTGFPARRPWALILGLAVTATLMTGEWVFGLAMTNWFRWFAFAVAGAVQVFGGAPFYRGAWRQLKAGASNMDTLVALGSTTAFGYSTWALFHGAGGHVYFMEAAAIISLITFGHWLEARVGDRATDALKALLNLAPPTARRLAAAPAIPTKSFDLRRFQPVTAPAEVDTPVADLQRGEHIVLRPGDRVPVDGTVLDGASAVDEAMLTGESVHAEKHAGDAVFAGTMNLDGRLVLRVTATGEATALAHIIAAVQRAQTSRADIQRLGDRISNVFVPVIVAIALAAGVFWFVHSGAEKAFIIAAGVLIVACPCAMGLATPAAIMAAANTAARRGILIRDGIALEKAGRITAVIFDKTGTLTLGQPTVAATFETNSPEFEIHTLAPALARSSTHPLSRAIAGISPAHLEFAGWQEIRGAGIEAKLSGNPAVLRLGSLRWLAEAGVQRAADESFIANWSAQGATIVGLAADDRLLSLFAVRDAVKPGAAAVVAQLQAQRLKTYLVTGDNALTAAAIARQVGIAPENVFAEVRPEQKAEFVKRLQNGRAAASSAGGERVAFVGDGINDAPALMQADLGIAVSRASDIAREAADIILLNSGIAAVPEALGLARAALRIIWQNLFWAFFYNALGVPLAACGIISPIFCAAAMGFSDLIVIGNALRLLRWRK